MLGSAQLGWVAVAVALRNSCETQLLQLDVSALDQQVAEKKERQLAERQADIEYGACLWLSLASRTETMRRVFDHPLHRIVVQLASSAVLPK